MLVIARQRITSGGRVRWSISARVVARKLVLKKAGSVQVTIGRATCFLQSMRPKF